MLALFAPKIHSDLLARSDPGSVPLLTVNCDSADLPARPVIPRPKTV